MCTAELVKFTTKKPTQGESAGVKTATHMWRTHYCRLAAFVFSPRPQDTWCNDSKHVIHVDCVYSA